MLLARAARAGVVAADLGCGPAVLLDGREVMMSVIAVRPVHVTGMVVIMVVIVIAVGAVDVALRLGRGSVGHLGHS